MESLIDLINSQLLPHWPFVSWLIVAMLFGQVMKNALWTKENARHRKPHWFWWWGYKSMVLHPVFAGALVGLLWRNPEAGVDGVSASVGYFAMAGALSTWSYQVIRSAIRKRAGIEIDLPGISDEPKDK